MTHWMESDWPERDEIGQANDDAINDLLRLSRQAAKELQNSDLVCKLNQAIDEASELFESDDPRKNGWVGSDGLP